MVIKLAAYCHLVLRLRMNGSVLLISLHGIDLDNFTVCDFTDMKLCSKNYIGY